jgi:hypothetical protein
MTQEEIMLRLKTDPDFVNLPRYDYSLAKLLAKFPDGAPARVMAQALCMTEEELAELQDAVVKKLRRAMGIRKDRL